MQASQTQTREDVEAAIDRVKETIDEYKYQLRWWIGATRVFWSVIIPDTVFFAAIDPFLPASTLSQTLETIAGVAGGLALLLGILLVIDTSASDYRTKKRREEFREAKRELQRLTLRLAYLEEQALRHMTTEQYMHQVPRLIKSYRKQADRYRRLFTTISIVTILFSAAITSFSGGWLDKYVAIPWIIPVLSALISILTSLTLFFKFREKGANLQQAADMMDWEHRDCTLGIGIYKGMAKEDKLTLWAERTEALRKEQQQKQLQLEQSTHAEQKAMQVNT